MKRWMRIVIVTSVALTALVMIAAAPAGAFVLTTNNSNSDWHTTNYSFTLTAQSYMWPMEIDMPWPLPSVIVPTPDPIDYTRWQFDSHAWSYHYTPDWTYFTWPTTVTILANGTMEGVNLVSYKSTTQHEGAPNNPVEAVHNCTVRMDSVDPATTASASGVDLALWHNHAITLSVAASDATSGVSKMWYRLDSGSWYSTTFHAFTVTVSSQADHVFYYYTVDVAGNSEATKNVHVKIDTTDPVTTVTGADDAWHHGPTTLTFHPTDALSGIAKTEYKIDGGAWTTGTTATVSSDGDHTVLYRSVDNAGNVETDKSVHVKIDTVAPVTTVTSGGEDLALWHNHGVTLTFAATDLHGVTKTEYKIDAGSWTTGPAVTVASEGDHTVLYRSTDSVGNVEADKSLHVKIDMSAPLTTVTGADDAWHHAPVTLTFHPTDSLSGVARSESKVDGGPWTAGATLTVSNDGDHTVLYRSVDNAGNVETDKSVHVKIDTGAPVTTVTSGGEDLALWHNHGVTLTFTATDAQGVAKTEYKIDGGSWTTGTAVAVASEGDHTVLYRSTDTVGNLEADQSVHVKIDMGAPLTTASGADDVWHHDPVTVTFTASDPVSGVARTEYKIDGGSWTSGAAVTVSSDGDHTVLYRSVDNAGNTEADKSVSVKVDATGPVTSAKAASGKKGHSIKLAYRVSDTASPQAQGVTLVVTGARGKTVKTITIGSCQTSVWYNARWTPGATGTYRYTVKAKDLAGNTQSKAGSAKVKVK
jgi:large repetitive protein